MGRPPGPHREIGADDSVIPVGHWAIDNPWLAAAGASIGVPRRWFRWPRPSPAGRGSWPTLPAPQLSSNDDADRTEKGSNRSSRGVHSCGRGTGLTEAVGAAQAGGSIPALALNRARAQMVESLTRDPQHEHGGSWNGHRHSW